MKHILLLLLCSSLTGCIQYAASGLMKIRGGPPSTIKKTKAPVTYLIGFWSDDPENVDGYTIKEHKGTNKTIILTLPAPNGTNINWATILKPSAGGFLWTINATNAFGISPDSEYVFSTTALTLTNRSLPNAPKKVVVYIKP